MINLSDYLNDNKLIVPEKLLVHLHSQLKLKAIDKTSYQSWDSISDYLNTYYIELKERNINLFHQYNSYGIGIKSANIERAIKGKKGKQKINSNTEVSYELLDFLCYASWNKSLIKTIFDPNEEWGDKTIYSITIPDYAKSEVGIKNNSKANIRPEIKLFAQRIYIELTTRKAAIPIDEEKDVIEEVYNSWHKLFCIIRDELKTLPVLDDLENPESVIGVAMKILNEALRPHLTEHQAKYRDWLAKAKENPKNKNISPQELQKKYPDYNCLIKSMKAVNVLLIGYSNNLHNLIK